ncbi:protein FLX-like 2 [Curcuma longa]|uniref:protein FLX-like 2 n=1 Tax=Curcuma longa TaxID=136217 RepID=UPI003D9F2F21
MGSKGRIPPHMRQPLPGPSLLHPDPFGAGIRPPGAFPFDMLPPVEVMEQKLASQHREMQVLATENQRFAATHSSLRQELAAAQQELQRLQNQMAVVKAEQDQQLRLLLDKIAKMEADLKVSESLKAELQQAHVEAQSLVTTRQELISKVQQMTQDLQRSHADGLHIPSLISELEALRQEYQHCRTTYEYERKLRIDHHESLQAMENNYVAMVREVEKLRAELTNASQDRTGGNALGGQFGANANAYKENIASGNHPVGQNVYEDGYGVLQGHPGGAAPYSGSAPGSASARGVYDPLSRSQTYDASRAPGYDVSRVTGYDAAHGGGFDGPRGTRSPLTSGHDVARGAGMVQTPSVTGNPAAPYGSAQAPPSYGAAVAPPTYGSTQQSTYGSGQMPTAYGTTQQASYGIAQTPAAYGTTQQSAYGTGQQVTHAGGGFEAPRGGNTGRR